MKGKSGIKLDIIKSMYDVIVVGAGHAGCEAALAASTIGKKTLLVSGNFDMAGSMPCNPSIGGPAKGIVVREIDALGGYMGKNADLCQIQIKMLNSSKGPAVRSLRAQADKVEYPKQMRLKLEKQPNLTMLCDLVDNLIVEDDTVKGIVLVNGKEILSSCVILTTGTYLNSKILRGSTSFESGPDNQPTTKGISLQLKELGFEVQRLKTGTPARIKKQSIDFNLAAKEPGDKKNWKFSFDSGYDQINKVSIDCHLIYTNKDIHDKIMENLNKSAMYGGYVCGVGPRYCPSIEDKVVRFNDKERHQIFLEPESLSLDDIYVQGFSTSMPIDVQDEMIRMLPGLKDAEVIRYAYAIEYDAINPTDLWASLETKLIKNLFCAGQINGTSGYEEAAAQGLMAGINACCAIDDKEPLILSRDEAYIGVLIDDLVTKGTKEPYRLLTSRAEFRLLLRSDNADLRLREKGYEHGLICDEQYNEFLNKKKSISNIIEWFNVNKIKMNETNNEYITSLGSSKLNESISYLELIKRPEINSSNILHLLDLNDKLDQIIEEQLIVSSSKLEEILEQCEIEIKYKGYIDKALLQANKHKAMEEKKIPLSIDYNNVINLALEAREKLNKIRPMTIGQASRISGVNPADISVLLIYLETMRK